MEVQEMDHKQVRKQCVHCGGDHTLENCPNISDVQLEELLVQLGGLQQGRMIFQDNDDQEGSLNKDYLYLDTCLTEDQMVTGKHLEGIHKARDQLVLHTNANKSKTNRKGYLGETAFWLDEQGIATVISLRTLEEKFHVMYDSKTC